MQTTATLQFSSPNHDARPSDVAVDMLLLHYTGMPTGSEALLALCDPGRKVSAHYLIEEDGRVFALVEENRRAWLPEKLAGEVLEVSTIVPSV